MPRAGWARSQPNRLRDRQSERQERRKRGASIDPSGYDAGKKIKGKKRHILVDTQGLLIHAIVHAADIQDRDGGVFVMATMFGMYPPARPPPTACQQNATAASPAFAAGGKAHVGRYGSSRRHR